MQQKTTKHCKQKTNQLKTCNYKKQVQQLKKLQKNASVTKIEEKTYNEQNQNSANYANNKTAANSHHRKRSAQDH